MSSKKLTPLGLETKEYHIFNPEDVKQTIEIPAIQPPKLTDLEVIEKIGKKPRKKKPSKKTKSQI